MTVAVARRTYLAEDPDADSDFLVFLKGSVSAAQGVPKLVADDGTEHQVPHGVFDALLLIAEALAEGRAVSVMPTDTQLTTQEAADYLGYSRPTLVKLLERGEIPFSRVGRHRRVMLRDLIEYEAEARSRRRTTLDQLTQESVRDGSALRTPDDDSTR
ncbi:hypothetical protein GCM10022377_28080 [Zhihengliuella alba]|uniref:Helix-turn-helix domain-containing protein n=2 Tax=Zhihengliuella alba TaxID=547018 RepID=A0ABP7E3R7_9MICC